MKTVLKRYTFSASAKTITLLDVAIVSLDKLALITDVTTGKILYNFADPSVRATVSNNVITLSALQGGEADTDKLRIDYELTDMLIPVSTTVSTTTPVAILPASSTLQRLIKWYSVQAKTTNTADVSVTISGTRNGSPAQLWAGDLKPSQMFSHSVASGEGAVHMDINTDLTVTISANQPVYVNVEYQNM